MDWVSFGKTLFNQGWIPGPTQEQSRGLAERGQEEEQENEQHYGYTLCLGYLATID